MWDKFQIVLLTSGKDSLASPEWVIDRLHAYSDYFQRVTVMGQFFRWLGTIIVMLLYSIDSIFSKMIFSILGMSLAVDSSKTGADFNSSLLGLLGNGAFQKIVQVGMGLGIAMLGCVGLWLYMKVLIGKKVLFGEVFSNLFTSAVIAFSIPMIIAITLRGGAYLFGSLAMRNFTTDPKTGQVSIAKTTSNLSEDFVWSFVKTDIVATGDAVTGQYQLNGGKRTKNPNWSLETVSQDAAQAALYNSVVAKNFLINPDEPRKENIGSQATGKQLEDFQTAFAGQKNVITPSVTSWLGELSRRIPVPTDVERKDDNWFESFTSKVGDLFKKADSKSNWGMFAMSTYDKDTYNVQVPSKSQKEGSGSKLIGIDKSDPLPFSPGRYYYYSINWSIILTLLAVGLLLADIFYKLVVAFLDLCATLFIGWGGMTATAESGRGNAVFIESMMSYGKVALVSGASLGLYIITTNYVHSMISALKASGTMNGVEALIANPVLLLIITFAFLNGSNAFIKFVGADAGFGIAGGAMGLLGARGLGKAVGKVKETAGKAMKKGVDSMSSTKQGSTSENIARRDEKRNYKKAGKIIEQAAKGKITPDEREARLEELGTTPKGNSLLQRKVQPNAQRKTQQRLGMLRQKVERGLASDEEITEYNAMNAARSGYSKPNLIQRATGIEARDLAQSPANQVDKQGQRKGAVDMTRLNANLQRPQNQNRPNASEHLHNLAGNLGRMEDITPPEGKQTQATTGTPQMPPHATTLREDQISKVMKESGTRKVNMTVQDKDTVVEPTLESGHVRVAPTQDKRAEIKLPPTSHKAPNIKKQEPAGKQTLQHETKAPDVKVNHKVSDGNVAVNKFEERKEIQVPQTPQTRKSSPTIPTPPKVKHGREDDK